MTGAGTLPGSDKEGIQLSPRTHHVCETVHALCCGGGGGGGCGVDAVGVEANECDRSHYQWRSDHSLLSSA